jgi:tRNA (guanine37-N1)-methyltransferase
LKKWLHQRINPAEKVAGLVSVYSSFDVVGDIAVIKLPLGSENIAAEVAQAILSCNTGVKTVLMQHSKVSGDFRLRTLTWLAGEQKTCTVHKEHGCLFSVDLATSYFSPRLSGERLRISKLVAPHETVVNMFAGVGCFSIHIAKRQPTSKVYSIDINPDAVKFMQHNIEVNKMQNQVIPMLGDAKELIYSQLQGVANRVLMPLPELAMQYLPAAVSALHPEGGWIHVHLFEHEPKNESAPENVKHKLADALYMLNVPFELPFIRVVRPTGPRWFQLVADVHIKEH